jgi:hypothetical protein
MLKRLILVYFKTSIKEFGRTIFKRAAGTQTQPFSEVINRKSWDNANNKPPPKACPLMAATVGKGRLPNWRMVSSSSSKKDSTFFTFFCEF